VLTPAYPGFGVEVEALNADATPIENLTVPAVIDHLADVIGGLERPPILIGHSAGGIHAAHAGSRLRRSGRGDQLGPDRGRARGAAVANQVHLPGASNGRPQEGCRGSPSSNGATHSPTPSPRRGPGRCTSATTSRPRCVCCGAVRWPPWSPATRTPSSTTTTTTGRRCCSSPAARTISCPPASSAPTPSNTNPT
jgi:pimeloyl-ACP methyl ester carboxylesterase